MPKKKTSYESKAKTVSIKFTSRAAVKMGDNFYTVEASEERMIPDIPDIDLATEKQLLWDAVNSEVDGQIDDIWEEIERQKRRK